MLFGAYKPARWADDLDPAALKTKPLTVLPPNDPRFLPSCVRAAVVLVTTHEGGAERQIVVRWASFVNRPGSAGWLMGDVWSQQQRCHLLAQSAIRAVQASEIGAYYTIPLGCCQIGRFSASEAGTSADRLHR